MSAIPNPLYSLIGNKTAQDAENAIGEDLKGAVKGIPSMLLNIPGLRETIDDYRSLKTGQPTPDEAQYQSEKAAGYPLGYRLLSPVANSLGVNTSGMEKSAQEGSQGGVLGHVAVPLAAPFAGEVLGRGLAAINPEIAQNAVSEHGSTGGSTIDPRTGQSLAGTRNISVGVAPERTAVHEGPFTPEHYAQFVQANADILAKHPDLAVGTHTTPDGMHRMEIVATTRSKPAAVALAQQLGEDHAYNLATDEKIPAGSTGLQLPVGSLEERLAQLKANSPQRETYSGTHFSDDKLDNIQGSRRGAPNAKGIATHEDAARIRLGTQTGMGEDAPAGFYTYKSGTIPDAAAAGKKNAYPVRGQYAFGSTDSPEFQAGYQRGVARAAAAGASPQVAHQLGLNSAEHALQDAGYDGYQSPTHPGLRFHFGDADFGYSGEERRGPNRPAPMNATELNEAMRLRKPAHTPFDVTQGAMDTINRDIESRVGPMPGGKAQNVSTATEPRDYYGETAGDNALREELLRTSRIGKGKQLSQPRSRDTGGYGLMTNGSGESPASVEAINRTLSERAHGISRVKIDSRTGQETPLIGVDAVDAQPGPYDILVQRGPQGEVELSRGDLARRR